MISHKWGDPNVDWEGIGRAADEIGSFLRKWGRIQVTTTKEKYGTCRVYLYFGWYQLFNITHPSYTYSRYPEWLQGLDSKLLSKIIRSLNFIVIPLQQRLYRYAYRKALLKRPHLREEILCDADFPELLEGL